MRDRAHLIVLAVAMATFNALAVSTAASEIVCKKSDRKFTLKDSETGAEVVKGYDCGPLRAEFIRLNEVAFALLEKKDSKRIAAAVGAPRIVKTKIVEAYRKLRTRFGTTYTERAVTEELPYQDTSREGYEKNFVTIFEPEGSRSEIEYFPAVDEMQKLAKGEWPKGTKLFVSEQADPQKDWRKFPTPTLWRSLTAQDIANLAESDRLFESTFPEPESFLTTVRNSALDFLVSVSGGTLPAELARLQGWHSEFESGCDLGAIPAKLSTKKPRLFLFETQMPELFVDAILLRNTSKKGVDVDRFLGETQVGTGLRRLDKPGRKEPGTSGLAERISIAPGQSVIVPTAMLLRPREIAPCCDYVPRDQTKAIDAVNEFKSAGYRVGMDDYQTPTFPIYFEVLPAYAVAGLNTSLGEISFERTRPLRLSFSVSLEEGSCPYLMSKTEGKDELWSDHGKILHSAQTFSFKGRHVERMKGAPSEFRIEEREPETAFVDMARLTVIYADGTKETFAPSLDVLKKNDGKQARLGWGQAVEFSFQVKDKQHHRVPVESELEVVGYYERMDLNRLADLNGGLTPGREHARDDASGGPFCPRPGEEALSVEGRVLLGTDIAGETAK